MRTNMSTTAIANVTTACAILRTSQAVKSGSGSGPAPERAPRRFRTDRHVAEAAVHPEDEYLGVEEGGRRVLLDPPEVAVPQGAIRLGARYRLPEQRVRDGIAVSRGVAGSAAGPALDEAAGGGVLVHR